MPIIEKKEESEDKEKRMSDSTQLFITEFMTEKNKLPKIKLEPAEKKIKLEEKDKEEDKN